MDNNFLLSGKTARHLYFDYAEKLPIIDYHNHLDLGNFDTEKRFENITELWLTPDPYKHRLLRMRGVPERYITGDSSDKEKFLIWCKNFPFLLGTPVYHWAKLELLRVFGLTDEINEENAETLWTKLNAMLKTEEYSAVNILKKFVLEYSAPCTSLFSEVDVFEGLSGVVPSLRGDDICAPTEEMLKKISVKTLPEYEKYIKDKINRFHAVGCRFSDHALDNGFRYYSDDNNNTVRFEKAVRGEMLSSEDRQKLFSCILRILCGEYVKRNWTMQLHIGAKRQTSQRLRALAGAAGGYAGIGNSVCVDSLTNMFDEFERTYGLPRIILFTLNPADNEMLSVLSGSFSKDGVGGLIMQGPAWWWCDHIYGIRGVLDSVCSFGLLSEFPGMTTDSRSILSFVRHEYFRRTLCSYLGEKIDSGEIEADEAVIKEIIEKVCYTNIKNRIGE